MSWRPTDEPRCERASGAIALVIEPRSHVIGGLPVRRTLPVRERRSVGPWVFLDHMGPTALEPGRGIDVPPHPHIGLATVTFLYEGEVLHRDSIGSEQTITAGDVNWMSAGRGIAHSERTPAEARARGSRVHGLQLWVALPLAEEESEPTFQHHEARALPVVRAERAELRAIAGAAYGATSPVRVLSPLFAVDARLDAGAELELEREHPERAVHVAEGAITCEGRRFEAGTLIVFAPGAEACVGADEPARIAIIGGAPLDAPRTIWWNFVSSSKERIERAKRDWKEGRFAHIPGESDFVPLP